MFLLRIGLNKMKKQFLSFLLLLSCVFSVSAQTKEARIIDETSDFCCEATRTRLDNFFVELQNNPKTKGYVIYYGGRNHPICSKNRMPKRGEIDIITTIFKKHVEFRGQDPKRFIWINGGYRENWTAEFWIVPNGADAPKPTPTPTLEERDIKFKRGKAKKVNLHCVP